MKLLIICLLLNIYTAHSTVKDYEGGDRVGNGGDVLLCDERGGKRLYILDEFFPGFRLQEKEKNIHYSITVSRILNKIRVHFPARYDAYIRIYNNFNASIAYTDSAMPEIDDEVSLSFDRCTKIQAAYFKKASNGSYKYHLQKQIWNSIDSGQKALLLMHEILYTEAVGLGTMTSASVRAANRLLFNNNDFDPIGFDNKFLLPLQYTGEFGHHTDQLQNAFSERIAINLLERDWSLLYTDKTMITKLNILKSRFSSNNLIAIYVREHINRINAINSGHK